MESEAETDEEFKSDPKKLKGSNSGNAVISHPKYAVMIRDAIVQSKQRKGSSVLGIAKGIEDKHKDQLPSNFRKMLVLHLRKLVKSGRLVKEDSNYRCTPAFRKNPDAKRTILVSYKQGKPPATNKAGSSTRPAQKKRKTVSKKRKGTSQRRNGKSKAKPQSKSKGKGRRKPSRKP